MGVLFAGEAVVALVWPYNDKSKTGQITRVARLLMSGYLIWRGVELVCT